MMVIGQSVIQNGVVMALASVVLSLYVIGLQRIRVPANSSGAQEPVHNPLNHPQSGNADV